MELTKGLTWKLYRLFKINKTRHRLHLVLDLDHTLIHTFSVSQLSLKELYLPEEADSRVDLWRFNQGQEDDFFIKLRPFTREFLQEASKLFSLSVYTMGFSEYAQLVLSVIDPGNLYFGGRVITRDQSPYMKTLDLVKADKRKVVIVDDTPEIWPLHRRNLLVISRYFYSREGRMSTSYAEQRTDENRSNGSLANVLRLLKRLHKRYQEERGCFKDLRLLIRETDPFRRRYF